MKFLGKKGWWRLAGLGVAVLLAGLVAACAYLGEKAPLKVEETRYLDEIKAFRLDKDLYFRSGEGSPIPEKDRGRFAALVYYPPDLRFRVPGSLTRYETPKVVTAQEGPSGGGIKAIGTIRFFLEGKDVSLEVWETGSGGLTVLFRDETSGSDSYELGRNLELQPTDGGLFILDFNYAYNPYCCYSNEYSCPMPPLLNRIPFPVTAGEKIARKVAIGHE